MAEALDLGSKQSEFESLGEHLFIMLFGIKDLKVNDIIVDIPYYNQGIFGAGKVINEYSKEIPHVSVELTIFRNDGTCFNEIYRLDNKKKYLVVWRNGDIVIK